MFCLKSHSKWQRRDYQPTFLGEQTAAGEFVRKTRRFSANLREMINSICRQTVCWLSSKKHDICLQYAPTSLSRRPYIYLEIDLALKRKKSHSDLIKVLFVPGNPKAEVDRYK